MATQYDPSEFVDEDFESGRKNPLAAATVMNNEASDAARAPTREEVDSKVGELQTKLADLKRAQSELERERSSLEETRRRQMEFTTGREEMVRHLTRGISLLEQAEFGARQDAEQMAKSLVDLREALVRIHGIQELAWTRENFNSELTKALALIESARMEWNSARLKFTVLNGVTAEPAPEQPASPSPFSGQVSGKSFTELCRLGLALTWPVALVALAIFLLLLLR